MAKLTREDVLKKAEELKNWGKWGPDDELGVLNYVTPEDIVSAARLIKRGKVFRLGLSLDENGPQRGIFGGRWNPMHQMLATGTDAVAGKHDVTPGLRYADDAINLPTQAATQWDALAHVFLGEKMWNGYPATLVDSRGAHKNGIEKFASISQDMKTTTPSSVALPVTCYPMLPASHSERPRILTWCSA